MDSDFFFLFFFSISRAYIHVYCYARLENAATLMTYLYKDCIDKTQDQEIITVLIGLTAFLEQDNFARKIWQRQLLFANMKEHYLFTAINH